MSTSRLRILLYSAFLLGAPHVSYAATRTVCKTGCQYSDLQLAINDAAPGDTILLRAGETFTGNVKLPAKSGTAWITIRSDASDSQLPADGVRLVPSGKPDANTSLTLLPRLVGLGGALKTTPVLRTAAGAHNYRLQFLEIDGSANLGFETLVQIGDDTTAAPPSDIVIDRVYIHGHPAKGQKRGITLNGVRCDVMNSYVSDIKAVNADSQGIAGYNGAGPFRIINNYVEAAAENILFGGSDPAVTGLVPADITISRNYFYKPLAWRNPILAAPGSPTAAAASGGALPAGTQYFKVVAVMTTDTRTAVSLPSAERAVTVSGSGAAKLTWSAVPDADRYRIYRGTSSGHQSAYIETPGSATSFTYTGSAETAGTPPTSGTLWVVKNIFELKNAARMTVDGNIMENIWAAGQYGYALVLTPENSGGKCTWCQVKDILFTNNIVRHAAGALNLVGRDARGYASGHGQNITFRNNLFDDISNTTYGGLAKVALIGLGASTVTFDSNTFIHTNSSLIYAYGADQMPSFTFKNNIARHQKYGIMGESSSPGLPSIKKYFPSSVIVCNSLAGGTASLYPVPNVFPTVADWTAAFADFANGDYRVIHPEVNYATGCADLTAGADVVALDAAIGGTPPPTPPPPVPANQPPVADAGGPYSGSVGTAVAADGGRSSDRDGTVTAWRWMWSDDVLVRARDVPDVAIHGSRWVRRSETDAASGVALHNPDRGEGKVQTAVAAPTSYIEFTVPVAAGVPYRLWLRMQAEGNWYTNDSLFVQFSGAADASGNRIYGIGTTDAVAVVLEDGKGMTIAGWGWNDAAYGSVAPPIYFAKSGLQTIRIQQREDGVMWDQLVLSSARYRSSAPGAVRADSTIVSTSLGSSTGVTASHTYSLAGVFPLMLTVTDDDGATASTMTTVTVK